MPENQAAFLDAKGQQLRVGSADTPKPEASEVIIRNQAVAINPLDWKIQDTGLFTETWPTILGFDIAGEVVEVGKDVQKLKKGDRVISHTNRSGFQLYTAAPAQTTTVLPSNVTFSDGVVVPVGFDAALYGLHDTQGFGLQAPSIKPEQSGKIVVVYGGSSSVGAMAIQLAVASGAKVIATASSHNFDFCKQCGATKVFDYKSSSVVDDVVAAAQSMSGDLVGVFDAISSPDSFKLSVPLLQKLGGGVLNTVLPGAPEMPSNIRLNNLHGYGPVIFPFWESYITQALEGGQLKCLPKPSVVGKGLESFQKGLEESRRGVSAKKLIVEL